jgi:hypothetical protein
MATLIQLPPIPALQNTLSLVEELIETVKEGSLSKEQYNWCSGQQDRIFESINHESECGTCECTHHTIGYLLGDIYEQQMEITQDFLVELRDMIIQVLEEIQSDISNTV